MNEAGEEISCLVCSIFRNEIEALQEAGELALEVRYIDSKYHIYPDLLQRELNAVLQEELSRGRRVLLMYGDCHAYMNDYLQDPRIARVEGLNCCQILLDSQEYRRLQKEGAFFLHAEWTHRWRDILPEALGLSDEETKIMMREVHSKLVFLDSGLQAVPYAILQEISEYTGLPFQILPISLEPLKSKIQKALARFEINEPLLLAR